METLEDMAEWGRTRLARRKVKNAICLVVVRIGLVRLGVVCVVCVSGRIWLVCNRCCDAKITMDDVKR